MTQIITCAVSVVTIEISIMLFMPWNTCIRI